MDPIFERTDENGVIIMRCSRDVFPNTQEPRFVPKELFHCLGKEPKPKVLVDFHGIRMFASEAAHNLARFVSVAREHGASIRLYGVDPILERLFRDSDVRHLLDIHETKEAALSDWD